MTKLKQAAYVIGSLGGRPVVHHDRHHKKHYGSYRGGGIGFFIIDVRFDSTTVTFDSTLVTFDS